MDADRTIIVGSTAQVPEELHPAYEGLLRQVLASNQAGDDLMSNAEGRLLFARMLTFAPQSYYARLDEIAPGDAEKWHAWALDTVERAEHPDFFRRLALLREHGEGMEVRERAKLLDAMLRSAPPRYAAAADEVIEPFLPKVTHVNKTGEPVYSAEQIAEKLGRPVEEIHSLIDKHVDPGRLYRGSVHRLQ